MVSAEALRQVKEGGAEVVLTRCRLVADTFAPQRGAEPRTYDWRDLCEILAPHGSVDAFRLLRQAQVGGFLGLARARNNPRSLGTFLMHNPDRSGDLSQKLRLDPGFRDRLVSVFRVEAVRWDGVSVQERKREAA